MCPCIPFVDWLAEKARVVKHENIFLSNGSGFFF